MNEKKYKRIFTVVIDSLGARHGLAHNAQIDGGIHYLQRRAEHVGDGECYHPAGDIPPRVISGGSAAYTSAGSHLTVTHS